MTSPITPESRADRLGYALSEETGGVFAPKAYDLIAQAIRDAENAAYERAAIAITPSADSDPFHKHDMEEAAEAIRSLKTKET